MPPITYIGAPHSCPSASLYSLANYPGNDFPYNRDVALYAPANTQKSSGAGAAGLPGIAPPRNRAAALRRRGAQSYIARGAASHMYTSREMLKSEMIKSEGKKGVSARNAKEG